MLNRMPGFRRTLLTGWLGLAVIGCSGEGGNSASGAGAAKVSKAEKAATRALLTKFDTHFTRCGDSWVTQRVWGAWQDDPGELTVYQFKHLSVTTPETSLSEADKLNGYEYRGGVDYGAAAVLRTNSTQDRQFEGWSEWSTYRSAGYGYNDGPYRSTLAKRNGVWDFSHSFPLMPIRTGGVVRTVATDDYTKITCAELPE